MVTLKPLDWSSFARDAEIIPFPKEELTPPVTKIYLVFDILDFDQPKIQKESELIKNKSCVKINYQMKFRTNLSLRVELKIPTH